MRALLFLPPLASTAAAATPPLPPPEAIVAEHARSVDGARMKQIVERLVGFGTRHTLSSQTDPKRGIGAAVRWAEAEMKSYGLEAMQVCDTVTGRRIPAPTRICNAVAIQRGTERPNDVVIITGHIDSRVSDVMDATSDAPGANDDGSGTAAVIEAARVLSKHKFPGTIVYAALSGEEQGLHGGKIIADYARAQGWNVIANLNNDIVGNSCGSDGVCNAKQVRIFSEGPRWQGREALASQIRSRGGENDSPSRNLSRFLDTLAERLHGDIGIDVMQIWRNDRFGRGGDHTEFLNAGFPAVRFSVAVEDYDHQHQDLRVEKGVKYGDTVDEMDFDYLVRVTKLNVAALAWLASAPPPPEPTVEGAVSTDTTVSFEPVKGVARYLLWWRRTDANQWPFREQFMAIPAAGERLPILCGVPVTEVGSGRSVPDKCKVEVVLEGIRVDDWVFGVSSVGANGFESPVAAAVPGGAFKPYVEPKNPSP
jgi:hypothetical protein